MPPITSSRDPIAAMMASHWLAAGHTLQTQVLRAPRWRELRSGNGDCRADGEALTGREDRARSKPRRTRRRAPASLRGNRRRSLRPLAAPCGGSRQIKPGRGDPLCRLAPRAPSSNLLKSRGRLFWYETNKYETIRTLLETERQCRFGPYEIRAPSMTRMCQSRHASGGMSRPATFTGPIDQFCVRRNLSNQKMVWLGQASWSIFLRNS
ncbi:hypothetical protein J2R96_001968 [Bradyrhizobium elkanii]|nr:hypothetical protein [Bradyrhizobium elkanii]